MTLHLVYRSHGSENQKDRPPYYSKAVALASVIDAAHQCPADPVELIFVNDGPIPADRVALMRSVGEVVSIRRGSNRGSYLFAVGLASRRRWADTDLVLFAEDDYLYRPDALEQLTRAGRSHPGVDYFYPYSEVPEPSGWTPSQPQQWMPHPTTTSTFAVRAAALCQDRLILRTAPFTGADWDHASLLAVQGTQPFAPHSALHHPSRARAHTMTTAAARAAFLTATKSALSVLVWRQRRRAARQALAAVPPLATHLEIAHLAWGTNWAERASLLRVASPQS